MTTGTSARLLRLLSLLQARRDWPGSDLAERLQVDVRTVRRDIEETSVRALAKLEQVLPARLRHRVAALNIAMIPLGGVVPVIDAEALTVIASACRDHQRLRFGYRGHHGDVTERYIEPLRLVHTGRRWYLVAFDLDRDDWRTFRVDRIDGVPALSFRFTPREPPAEDLAAYVSRAITSSGTDKAARFARLARSPIETSEMIASTMM